MVLVSLLLLACASTGSVEPGDDGTVAQDDSGAAVQDGGSDETPLQVDFTDVGVGAEAGPPLVVTVSWTTDVPTEGAVLLPDGTQTSWGEVGTSHEATVVGLPYATETALVLLARDGEQLAQSEPVAVSTPSGSDDLGEPDLSGEGGGQGYWVVPVFDTTPNGGSSRIMAFDSNGDVVWAKVLDSGWMTTSVQVDLPRGRILGLAMDQIFAVDLVDGSIKTLYDGFIHHDFTLLPDGSVAGISRRMRTGPSGEQWLDDIVEISPEGEVRMVSLAEDLVAQLGLDIDSLVGSDEYGLDPMHSNALEYDAEHDVYVVGMPGLGTVAGVSRETGALVFATDLENEVAWASPYTLHHEIDIVDDGMIMFVNNTDADACARVVELEWAGAALVETWRWPMDRCESIVAYGGVKQMPGGMRVVAWSHQGKAEVVGSDGQVVQTLRFSAGTGLGYIDWTPSLQPG